VRGAVVSADEVGEVLRQAESRDRRWVVDYATREKVILYALTGDPVSIQTEYQKAALLPTERFGQMLMLDGVIQLTERDEFIYHELLIHPALAPRGGARNSVLVLGGGDGCAAREVCRYADVREVVVVDLDAQLVEWCKTQLRGINQAAFEDPRVNVVAGDALAYLRSSDRQFDVIVSDLTDPDTHSPADDLYSAQTFETARHCLRPGGLFVVQSCSFSHHSTDCHMRAIGRDLMTVFQSAVLYGDYVPSFDGIWCFWMAGDRDFVERCRGNPPLDLPEGLRFYTEATHRRVFSLADQAL